MNVISKISDLRKIENQLEKVTDDHQRLHLLNQLASHYSFTNIKKGQEYLTLLEKTLKVCPDADFQFDFHLHTAFIENQLYNYILAEIHFKQAQTIIEDRGDVKEQVELYIDYAGTCINLDKRELATTLLDKAAGLLEAFPDQRLKARLTCREGYLSLHYANYGKAIELLLEADKEINALPQPLTKKDYYFLTLIHSGIGNIYERNNDIQKSVRAYLNAVRMCEAIGMRTRLSWHYQNLGKGFMAMQDLENAEEYLRKAIRITDDISRNARASAYANLGNLYQFRQQYQKALEFYKQAEKLYSEKGDDDIRNLALLEKWRGEIHSALDKPRKALEYFKNAVKFATEVNDNKQLSAIFKEIAALHATLGDFENAYKYQLLYDHRDGLYMQEVNRRTILELEVKYEAEKKKQEAEVLRLQATGLQLKALRAQMNPHFMYNALNSIQHYITSQDITAAAKYLAKFAKLMRQSLDYSDMEIISLEKEIDFLGDYLYINQKLRFEDKLEYQIKIDEEIEEDIMGIPTMLIQPFIENALEHGLRKKKKGLVKLEFSLHDDNTIKCTVEDNGIGRVKARELQMQDPMFLTHQSKGSIITEQRLEILNKSKRNGVYINTIDLQHEKTGKAKGTRVEMLIPIETIQKWQ